MLCVYEGENVVVPPADDRGSCIHHPIDDHSSEADGIVVRVRAADDATHFKVVAVTWGGVAYAADLDITTEFQDLFVPWSDFACVDAQNCPGLLDGLLSVDSVGLAATEIGEFHAEVETITVHTKEPSSPGVCIYQGENVVVPPAGARGGCIRHISNDTDDDVTAEPDGIVVRARTIEDVARFKVSLLTWDKVRYAADIYIRPEFRDVVAYWSIFSCEVVEPPQNCSMSLEELENVDTVGLVAMELGEYHVEVESIAVHRKRPSGDGPMLSSEAIIVIAAAAILLLLGLLAVGIAQVRKQRQAGGAGASSNQVSLVIQDAEGS